MMGRGKREALGVLVGVWILMSSGCILDPDSMNHPPVIRALTAVPSPVDPDSLATLSVAATDADWDRLHYRWEAGAGSFPGDIDRPSVPWRAPGSAGPCTVSVFVSDGTVEVRGDLEITVREAEPPAEIHYTYEVLQRYPHDPEAFTQGLVFHKGFLYEGTGLVGRSSLRKVDLETGDVLQRRDMPRPHFGEGITIFGERILQLTWQSYVGFIFDRASFDSLGQFTYSTKGWGLTHDGTRLIMSDGTPNLYFLDPETLERIGEVPVSSEAGPVWRINELEYIDGEVFANIWQTDRIARIDPATGRVTGWIELPDLLTPEERQSANYLNGIAWDEKDGRLFVTGKLWPWVFEIRIIAMGEEGRG